MIAHNIPDSLEEYVAKKKYKQLKLPQQSSEKFLTQVASQFAVNLPEEAVEHKLAALLAETKMQINADPLYNVLADFIYILDRTFKATGVSRSLSQVQAEALDILLQTVSKDQKTVSKEFFYSLLKERAHGYRDLPADFNTKLDEITQECKEKNAKSTAEERINIVFAAYLGSINQTEAMWLHNNRPKAEQLAKLDLLYDRVAEQEKIIATEQEITERLEKIAVACQIPVGAVEQQVDLRLVKWQICREKAKAIILKKAK